MNSEISITKLKETFWNYLHWLRHHAKILLFIVTSLLYGFLLIQIGRYSQQQPSDSAVNEQVKQVRRPSIDTDTARKLESLEDTSQEVQSLFQAARKNPFQE